MCVGLLSLGCDSKGTSKEVAPGTPAVVSQGSDKECCMGKNECKGKGGCAVPESHGCAGKNECRGQGGCNMHCPKK